MPRIYSENATPRLLYSNYIATYVERDVNAILALKDKRQFETENQANERWSNK